MGGGGRKAPTSRLKDGSRLMWNDVSLLTLMEQRGQFLPFNPQINSVYAVDIQNASGYAWHNFPAQNAALGEKAQISQNNLFSDPCLFPCGKMFYTCSSVGIRSHNNNSSSGLTCSILRPYITPIPKTIAGMWLAWRGDICSRVQEDNSELFLVALIKILVFGKENFSGQFLGTISHPSLYNWAGWIRGGIKPNKHTQHPPKKPKFPPFLSQHSGQVCAWPVHTLRLIKWPKTKRNESSVTTWVSPTWMEDSPSASLVLQADVIRSTLQDHQLMKTSENHGRNPPTLQPCHPGTKSLIPAPPLSVLISPSWQLKQ